MKRSFFTISRLYKCYFTNLTINESQLIRFDCVKFKIINDFIVSPFKNYKMILNSNVSLLKWKWDMMENEIFKIYFQTLQK